MSFSLPNIQGAAFYCGDFVDTDVMAPGRFEPYTSTQQQARCALIDYASDPPFVDPEMGYSPFQVIIAGQEFGCGSSRETAPQNLYYAGCRAVIARSFASIFYRNCINMGLLLPIAYPHSFDASIIGEHVLINVQAGYFMVVGQRYPIPDFGPVVKIIAAGGLTNYTKQRMARQQT